MSISSRSTGRQLAGGVLTSLVVFLGGLSLPAGPATAGVGPRFVRLQTDAGEILLVLNQDLAPHHADQFWHLARTGFYEGTSFHRIVPGFVIQGGDPNTKDGDPNNDGQGGPRFQDVLSAAEYASFVAFNELLATKGYAPLPDRVNLRAEFSQSARHRRGTLSMARARTPDSAGSQFFICVADTPQLDGKYTIFGSVVLGMDVADQIVSAPQVSPGSQKPAQPVRIRHVTAFEGMGGLTDPERQAWQSRGSGAGG